MMEKNSFRLLRDFIYEKTGIFFQETKMYLLENRLQNRIRELGLSSFEDYYYYLKFATDGQGDELKVLYDLVTTNETSFFRHPEQIEALKTVLKEYCLRNPLCGPIKIWSAACSTGDEAYTVAIVILELSESLRSNLSSIIYGTDISHSVLKRAKEGIYSDYNLRSTPEEIKKKYFEPISPGYFKIKDHVKRLVRFEFFNLVDFPSYYRFSNFDFVLCRNVLIYFGEEMKRKVIESIYKSLKSGGYLLLGHAETLTQRYGFRPQVFPKAILYQKGGKDEKNPDR